MERVRVYSRVSPSEDEEKVRKAILNIFPGSDLIPHGNGLLAETDLKGFSSMIRRQKILDSTRKMMLKGIRNGRIELFLNKQVAFVGKISFTEPRSILGAIEVEIYDDDLEALIDRVSPTTVDGVEVRQ